MLPVLKFGPLLLWAAGLSNHISTLALSKAFDTNAIAFIKAAPCVKCGVKLNYNMTYSKFPYKGGILKDIKAFVPVPAANNELPNVAAIASNWSPFIFLPWP
jgi:hypothetical protein